jgi:hypothetical protein
VWGEDAFILAVSESMTRLGTSLDAVVVPSLSKLHDELDL